MNKLIKKLRYMLGNIKLLIIKLRYPNNFFFSFPAYCDPTIHIELRDKDTKLIIGSNFTSRRNVTLRVSGILNIGNNVFMNDRCNITCNDEITIGNETIFGPNVMIFDHDHDFRSEDLIRKNPLLSTPVIIGENVWLGANAFILRGTKIGDGTVVGAGTVAKGEIPAQSLVVSKKELTIVPINKKR